MTRANWRWWSLRSASNRNEERLRRPFAAHRGKQPPARSSVVARIMKKGAWLYAIAPAVCLLVFWRMPFIWFRGDDFAWLEMHLEVHDLHSLLSVLFRPEAQGTVRVLGDRIPFLILSGLFGTWAAPFRVLTLI